MGRLAAARADPWAGGLGPGLAVGYPTQPIAQSRKLKKDKFPILFLIFKHFLIIPASSAASESNFFKLTNIITKKRNSLKSTTVKKITLLKN